LEAAESGDEGLFGEMFAADINNGPSSFLETPNSHHLLRDFGKPSGLNPRRVLEEACKARYVVKDIQIITKANVRLRDPASKVVFQDLSVSTYSNRKAVEIQWSKPQEEPFSVSVERVTIRSNPFTVFASMDTIATSTSLQAEGYASTLGLFLISGSNTKEGKAYLRLPAVWRELWTEFSETKKQQEDETDKAQIKRLRDLVRDNHGKFENDVVLSENFKRRNGNSKPAEPVEAIQDAGQRVSAEKLSRLWKEKSSTPAFQKMTESRKTLPIWAHKQEILDTLENNQAVIICSETGSGKSTQIPSFIMENELANGRECKIYITEPRRISAISLARRVSEELGEKAYEVGTSRSLVGYAIRLESKITQSTKLIFAYVFLIFTIENSQTDAK
jgi:ATP-dependent RNA helicase DHX29